MADRPVTLRLPNRQLDQVDQLITALQDDPTVTAIGGGELSRSAVLRFAIAVGLQELDRRYPDAQAAPRRRKRSA